MKEKSYSDAQWHSKGQWHYSNGQWQNCHCLSDVDKAFYSWQMLRIFKFIGTFANLKIEFFPHKMSQKRICLFLEYAENLLIQWEIKIYICKSHAKWVKPDDWKKYSVLTIMLAASFGQIWSSSDLSVVQVTTVEKSESRELLSASRPPPATALKIFPSVPSFLLW